MAVMADQARTFVNAPTARKQLCELQVQQHHHDEHYHREIARLSLHQRLNHMALHFAKYAGKVAATGDVATLLAVYVDVLIISLSTTNILNLDLWELVEPEKRDYPGLLAFGRTLALRMNAEMSDRSVLLRETVVASGRMAAACEKIDHLEDISFRKEIAAAIQRLSAIALAILAHHAVDPVVAIHERLNSVKQRLKLHGRI